MKLKIGREFESVEAHIDDKEAAPVITAVANARLGVTRKIVVYILLAMGALFIFGAAIFGLWDGSFDELQTVWVCIAPFVGMIVGHYFPVSGEGNDKRSG